MRIFYSAVIGIVLGSLFPPLLISQTWTADKRSNDVESTRFLIGGRIVVSLPEQTVESIDRRFHQALHLAVGGVGDLLLAAANGAGPSCMQRFDGAVPKCESD